MSITLLISISMFGAIIVTSRFGKKFLSQEYSDVVVRIISHRQCNNKVKAGMICLKGGNGRTPASVSRLEQPSQLWHNVISDKFPDAYLIRSLLLSQIGMIIS